MKKKLFITALALAGAVLITACAGSGTVSQDVLYRGEILSIEEDGSILVGQLPGQNYGQAQILFHVSDKLAQELKDTLIIGAFIEVHYDGRLTRSLPAQATAESINIIASYSDGIVQNGTILGVTMGKDGYSLSLLPFGAEQTDDLSTTVTLTVPMFALEGLSEADLVEGLQVSAVTMGIAAMSMPPIMPVIALAPYAG